MLKLRKFSLSDLDQILEIEKASFPNRIVYSDSYFKKLYQKYPEGFIVAEVGKKIVGYAIGQIKSGVGEIVSIAINPRWRKKGVGKKLTEFLFNNFQKRGVKLVSLHVRENNKIAVSFYQELGFKILKKIENYYQNGDNAYLMQRKLGA